MTREEAIKWLSRIDDKYIHGGDEDFDTKRKQALDMAIEALSAETVPQSEQYKKGFENAKRAFLVEYARESQNMRKRIAQKGEWADMNGNPVPLNEDGETTNSCWCSECGEWLVASDEYPTRGNFCPNCGADMRSE